MATYAHTAGMRMPWRGIGIVLGIVAALLLVAVATAPPLRRIIARPAEQPAVVGISTIDVVGDWFENHRYSPPVVEVPIGATVTWNFIDRGVNGDEAPVPHNVIGDGWGSPVLAEGSFSHTFDAPGRYTYTCTLHGGMDGVIVVVE